MRGPGLAMWVAIGAVLLSAAPVGAADQADALLGPRDLDPALILPPPPAPDSDQAAAELAELHAAEQARTPAAEATARREGKTRDASIFAEVLGPRFDLAALPATARLMATVRASENAVVDRGKAEFRRPRPFAVDATLHPCKLNDDPRSSYPSGHTTMAYSMAAILARLVPARAPALLNRAARYAQSRIVCGQHFRSDVTAGEALGLVVAERLLAKPAFRRLLASARVELVAATVAKPD